MTSGAKPRSFLLGIGVLLIGAGLVFVGIRSSGALGGWFARLWPLFLVLAGMIRLIGFAGWRRPASPLAGILLVLSGAIVMAVRANEGSSFLELYGRYWPSLLLIYGLLELIRFYSHKRSEGPPPKVLSTFRVIVILFIIASGVLASVAVSRPMRVSNGLGDPARVNLVQ